jgi:hypothetical protein
MAQERHTLLALRPNTHPLCSYIYPLTVPPACLCSAARAAEESRQLLSAEQALTEDSYLLLIHFVRLFCATLCRLLRSRGSCCQLSRLRR